MRSQRLLAFVLALTGLLLGACAWSRVTHVVDGDTIDVQTTGPDTDGILVQGETYRVRLIGTGALLVTVQIPSDFRPTGQWDVMAQGQRSLRWATEPFDVQ